MNKTASLRQKTEQTILQSKHWVFDMDGTLTQHIHNFVDMRRQLGLPDDMMMLEAISELPPEEAAELSEKLERMELDYAELAKPMPHIHDFLQLLLDNGASIGILTRNTLNVAKRTLEVCNLTNFFQPEHILDRNLCPPKPSPAGIIHLLKAWQAPTTDAVMIGDYLLDLEAGRNAGVHTIHLDTSNQFPWPEHTDLKASHFQQLIQWFEK